MATSVRSSVYYSAATGRQIRGGTQDRREPNLSNIAYGNVSVTNNITSAANIRAANIVFANSVGCASSNVTWTLPAADATASNVSGTSSEFTPLASNKAGNLVFAHSLPQYAVVTVSSSANTLYSAGRQILPAPGTGYFYVIHSATIDVTAGSVAMTMGSAANTRLQYGSTINAGGTIATANVAATGLFDVTTGNRKLAVLMGSGTAAVANTALYNQPIYLVQAGGDMTAGTGTIVNVFVQYSKMNY